MTPPFQSLHASNMHYLYHLTSKTRQDSSRSNATKHTMLLSHYYHIHSAVFVQAVAICAYLGLTATAPTQSTCPLNILCGAPVSAFTQLTVPFSFPQSNVLSSATKHADWTSSSSNYSKTAPKNSLPPPRPACRTRYSPRTHQCSERTPPWRTPVSVFRCD